MIASYVLNSDFGANKEGDIIQLDPEQAQGMIDAGVLTEAKAEDMNQDVPEQDDEAPAEDMNKPEEASISKTIQKGFDELKKTMINNAKASTSTKGYASISNAATVKTPAIRSLGELLRCQYKALSRSSDSTKARNQLKAYTDEVRLKAPAGANEGTNTQGGYAVIPEWTSEIFSKVKNLPRLFDMCRKETISGNTLNIPALNETSLVDGSRGAGILAYWVAEAGTATTSYPVMNQVQAVLNTQVVMVPVTNQLLEDNAYNLDSLLAEKVGEEFTWQEDYAVLSGSGSSQPKGILNQPALVTVAKEAGQSNATIVFPNLAKMWARIYPASRANAVWLANPQVYQQLVQMTFPNSSGTYSAFGALTFSAADEFQLRIFGKPVIECLMAPDLGLPGDLLLVDLKQLYAVEHPGLKVDVSDQVYFTSLQTLFRFVRRYDLQSPWTAALTDFNNHYSYSPFIALASRGT